MRPDKIASSVHYLTLPDSLTLTDCIPAREGTVVAVRVLDEKSVYNQLEDIHGRMRTVHAGDIVVGVLGARDALRGYTGIVPDAVRSGDTLHLLNLGGVIGRCTSANASVGEAARVEVLGALSDQDGAPMSIHKGHIPSVPRLHNLPPVIFIAGSCMHAGKTAAACSIIRGATQHGFRIAAVKLTGVALRRDLLEMEDRGAVSIHSFHDAGLPSTCSSDRVVQSARDVLAAAASTQPDVILAELGDGLLGTYGVQSILLDPQIQACASAVVLAAADPVAAWGGVELLRQWGLETTAITGPATDNQAGRASVHAATGVLAANGHTDAAALVHHVLQTIGLLQQPQLAEVG